MLLGLAIPLASPAAFADDRVEVGRSLFEHKWTAGDPLCPQGDGLGPMYNADSCVACHSLGGIGGAGASERNVSLLSVEGLNKRPSSRESQVIRTQAGKFNPAFGPGLTAASSIVFHQFSTEPRYDRWRLSILGVKLPPQPSPARRDAAVQAADRKHGSAASPVTELAQKPGLIVRLSQRNTPPLFGAKLIDSISEQTLVDLAKEQAERFPGIEGRVGRTAQGKVARFGWRGQAATLRDFVLTACAVELGLQNDGHEQARNPLEHRHSGRGNDLTKDQCDALIAFVASLPAPRQLPPANEYDARLHNHGAKLFESTGCTACHVRDVGEVAGIYSDLLLHDMGAGLEDPVPAFPEGRSTRIGSSSGSSAYYGGPGEIFADTPPRLRREWRTPPLWGLRDSGPYLHDGRAATIEQAISAHGGEAENAARKYAGLDFQQRSHLVLFLKSLAAPEPPAE